MPYNIDLSGAFQTGLNARRNFEETRALMEERELRMQGQAYLKRLGPAFDRMNETVEKKRKEISALQNEEDMDPRTVAKRVSEKVNDLAEIQMERFKLIQKAIVDTGGNPWVVESLKGVGQEISQWASQTAQLGQATMQTYTQMAAEEGASARQEDRQAHEREFAETQHGRKRELIGMEHGLSMERIRAGQQGMDDEGITPEMWDRADKAASEAVSRYSDEDIQAYMQAHGIATMGDAFERLKAEIRKQYIDEIQKNVVEIPESAQPGSAPPKDAGKPEGSGERASMPTEPFERGRAAREALSNLSEAVPESARGAGDVSGLDFWRGLLGGETAGPRGRSTTRQAAESNPTGRPRPKKKD